MYWKEEKSGYPVAKGYTEADVLAEGQIEIAAEEYEALVLGIPPTEEELLVVKMEGIRAKRQEYFEAFDIYKSNVVYGIEVESEAEKTEIITWYQILCDLPEVATVGQEIIWPETPQKVAKYLRQS